MHLQVRGMLRNVIRNSESKICVGAVQSSDLAEHRNIALDGVYCATGLQKLTGQLNQLGESHSEARGLSLLQQYAKELTCDCSDITSNTIFARREPGAIGRACGLYCAIWVP